MICAQTPLEQSVAWQLVREEQLDCLDSVLRSNDDLRACNLCGRLLCYSRDSGNVVLIGEGAQVVEAALRKA